MSEMRTRQLAKWFGLDVAAWCFVPSVFLFVYVRYHSISAESVVPHLQLVLIGLLVLTAIRIATYRLTPALRVARILASCVISAVLMSMLLYYSLVLIGLRSWARVVSWDLIASYVVQLPGLLDTIELPVPLAATALSVLYLSLAFATYIYVKKFDWVGLLVQETSGLLQWLIVVAGFAICMIALFHFVSTPPVEKSEPLSLTFFPAATAKNLQGHTIDNLMAQKLDRLDDMARSSYKPGGPLEKNNLILIVVDALRPDHMSVYGYRRETTPKIAKLLQSTNGHVIENVRASCGDSSCGLLSLASSKFLHQFSNRPFTLQQVLRKQGYRVGMILGGDHTNFYGLKEQYGEVDSYFDGSMTGGAYYANDDELVLDRVRQLPAHGQKPVMLQFHLMSAHVLGKRHDRFTRYSPSANYALLRDNTSRDQGAFVNFYDNGVVQADAIIHDLLSILQGKGYLDRALVVVTADHGEALGEHGLFAHANSVHEQALRIPLIFIPYGYESKIRPGTREAAAQVDIAPTILADFGFSIPGTWSGIPLQQARTERYTYFQEGPATGLIDHSEPKNLWKYWTDAESGKEYAYNLARDPAEMHNLIDQVSPQLKREWRFQQVQLMRGLQTGG